MEAKARLQVIDSFGVRRTLPLKKPVFTIGRRVDSDLQIKETSVSRQHGEITCEDGIYYVVDAGSKTGIFKNGLRVQKSALANLDRISLGGVDNYQIQFFSEELVYQSSSPVDTPLISTEHHLPSSAREKLKNLTRFVEVNQAFKSSLTPDDVLRVIVDAAIELASADRGLLMLKGPQGKLEFKVGRDNLRTDVPRREFALSTSVVRQVFNENRTVVLNTMPGDEGSQPQSVYNLQLRTVICIPLHRFQVQTEAGVTKNLRRELIGVLYLDSRRETGMISKTNYTLLDSLAFEASKAFENVRLVHEEQEKRRLEREFEMAREVQVALLPANLAQSDYFELAAHSIPCRYVGGDFYDLLTLQDGKAVLTLGDVSGKGIAAALLAAVAQGVIEAQFLAGHSPAEVAAILNLVVVNRSDANRFITLFCAVLDHNGSFTWINAGHNPPVLARTSGAVEALTTHSLVLGAFDFAEYRISETKLDHGDVVFTFSDGVTEAVNAAGEMFGEERLLQLIQSSVDLSAEQIRDRVLEDVLNFTRGLPQGDDITVVALKMK